ncbi:MAG: hypothetical protein ACO20H_06060 [Bacteriovoracaceae bacterium]
MNGKSLLLGAALTGIVAGLSGCATKTMSPMGQCHGINGCKGQGACGGKSHGCAGQNKCKGQGWLKMNQEDCEAQDGEFKA